VINAVGHFLVAVYRFTIQ